MSATIIAAGRAIPQEARPLRARRPVTSFPGSPGGRGPSCHLPAEWGAAFHPHPHPTDRAAAGRAEGGSCPQAFPEEAPVPVSEAHGDPGCGDRQEGRAWTGQVSGPGHTWCLSTEAPPVVAKMGAAAISGARASPSWAHGFVVCPPECGGR